MSANSSSRPDEGLDKFNQIGGGAGLEWADEVLGVVEMSVEALKEAS